MCRRDSTVSVDPFESYIMSAKSRGRVYVPFSNYSVHYTSVGQGVFFTKVIAFSAVFQSVPTAFPFGIVFESWSSYTLNVQLVLGLCHVKFPIPPARVTWSRRPFPLARVVFSAYALLVLSLGHVSPLARTCSKMTTIVSDNSVTGRGSFSYAQGRGLGSFEHLSAFAGSPD